MLGRAVFIIAERGKKNGRMTYRPTAHSKTSV